MLKRAQRVHNAIEPQLGLQYRHVYCCVAEPLRPAPGKLWSSFHHSQQFLTDRPSMRMPSLRRNSFSRTMLPTTACSIHTHIHSSKQASKGSTVSDKLAVSSAAQVAPDKSLLASLMYTFTDAVA